MRQSEGFQVNMKDGKFIRNDYKQIRKQQHLLWEPPNKHEALETALTTIPLTAIPFRQTFI